jgi:HEAT repeat protein
MEDIRQFNEDDYLLNYYTVGLLGAADPDPRVRLMAVLTLTEYDEDDELVSIFMRMAEEDNNVEVRAAATAALAGAVEQGELEEIPEALLQKAENCLLRIFESQEAKVVRLRALEALGYSSRDEVKPLIKEAYRSQETEWLTSALIAMGRSYDNEWAADILAGLADTRPGVRQEAAAAAGELYIEDARPILIEMLMDEESGSRQAAIWALSQIGGNNIREILENLQETTTDEDEADYIEEALENLEFTEGFAEFDILDLDKDLEDFIEDDDEDFKNRDESQEK